MRASGSQFKGVRVARGLHPWLMRVATRNGIYNWQRRWSDTGHKKARTGSVATAQAVGVRGNKNRCGYLISINRPFSCFFAVP